MEKQLNKKRDIRFHSAKNGDMVTVHSKEAKRFAESLEQDEEIMTYQSNILLENWKDKISTVGIRTSYLNANWTSDFMLAKKDGGIAVREVVSHEDLTKKSEIEQLEISRRYWKVAHVADWGIVVVRKEDRAW